jgi:hypothetical protein
VSLWKRKNKKSKTGEENSPFFDLSRGMRGMKEGVRIENTVCCSYLSHGAIAKKSGIYQKYHALNCGLGKREEICVMLALTEYLIRLIDR